MELLAGFPYTVSFADALAASLANVLYPPVPKKGLITDLDDTLWSGIVGEVGVEGVSWSQDRHTQVHGLYQQMLAHLAGCGVLLGVCSKNEISMVEAALARKDFFLNPESLFPVHANWGPKSASVAKVLKTWNIAADSVVFVDDNPMELDEVQRAHLRITCILFPAATPRPIWEISGRPARSFRQASGYGRRSPARGQHSRVRADRGVDRRRRVPGISANLSTAR